MSRITIYNGLVISGDYSKESAVKPVSIGKQKIAEENRNYEVNYEKSYALGICDQTYTADRREKGGKNGSRLYYLSFQHILPGISSECINSRIPLITEA